MRSGFFFNNIFFCLFFSFFFLINFSEPFDMEIHPCKFRGIAFRAPHVQIIRHFRKSDIDVAAPALEDFGKCIDKSLTDTPYRGLVPVLSLIHRTLSPGCIKVFFMIIKFQFIKKNKNNL